MGKIINRTVILLGLISLFTDLASEMLYPVLPLYLETIGFGVLGIGILEGIAEATAGLSKGFFGQWSDRLGKRRPFVQWGYGISALAKPIMALFTQPVWILFTRTLDRVGKGIRTGARDSLLSAAATPTTKARVFGFHRALDTTGAALGPLLALLFLWYYPGEYRWLFALAVVPGLIAILATLLLKDPSRPTALYVSKPGFFEFMRYLKSANSDYRRLLVGLVAFALINSSDMFLLLLLKDSGYSDVIIIGYYVFYNLIYALAAYPFGVLADRIGLKSVFVGGLGCFMLVYISLPFASGTAILITLFAVYGLFAAATDGVAKAWIANLIPQAEMGTAVGAFSALTSIATLLASSGAGIIWYFFGAWHLFMTTALLALIVVFYFLRLPDVISRNTSTNGQ